MLKLKFGIFRITPVFSIMGLELIYLQALYLVYA